MVSQFVIQYRPTGNLKPQDLDETRSDWIMVFSGYVNLFRSRLFPGTALSQPSPDITFGLA